MYAKNDVFAAKEELRDFIKYSELLIHDDISNMDEIILTYYYNVPDYQN